MTEARQLIQSLYDAFARGDVDHVLGSMAPDIQWFEAEGNPMAEGDQVVVFGRYQGVHRESGERLDAPFVHHWVVRNGQVTRFQQYTDTAQMTHLYG
jgi:hypothetical protein